MTECNIGDLESQDRGSAARANQGKLPWGYMPLRTVASILLRRKEPVDVFLNPITLMNLLGKFQERGDYGSALELLTTAVAWLIEDPGDGEATFEGAMTQIIAVWQHGEIKYAKFNWMKGMPWSEVVNSAARHIMAVQDGEYYDRESLLPHIAHLACNATMLVHYTLHYPEGNDLPVQWFTK